MNVDVNIVFSQYFAPFTVQVVTEEGQNFSEQCEKEMPHKAPSLVHDNKSGMYQQRSRSLGVLANQH